MPVISKPVSKSKQPPPILGPKPYRNNPKQAWRAVDSSPTRNIQVNGFSEEDAATTTTTNKHKTKPSILRQPSSDPSQNNNKSGATVTFCDPDYENAPTKYSAAVKPRRRISNERDPAALCSETLGASGGDAVDFPLEPTKPLPKPPRSTISNAKTLLKECEEYTDWVNEILASNHLPLISDLRTSIGDGYILPTLLEIIAGGSLSCVKTNPQSKDERVRNILHCLKFLCGRGVDITGLEPAEIEGGHLKSILHLVGNIRNHFKDSYRPELNGFASHVGSRFEPSDWSPDMPGAIKLPGAVPTPFLQNRDPPHRHGPPDLPGVMAGECDQETKNTKPHSNIISTTEIGVNGVAQHGVDERRNHFGMNNNNNTGSINGGYGAKKGMVIRHPNARPLTESGNEGQGAPPNTAQRAWTESPSRLQSGQGNNGVSTSPSVEDRLRQLISSKQSVSSTGTNGSTGRQNNQPSRPRDKREGSRADIIRYRPPSAIAFRQPQNNPQVASPVVRARPSSATGNMIGSSYGRDNLGYMPDNGAMSAGNTVSGGNKSGVTNQSPGKASSNDLRNAWNRLYGSSAQAPPYVSPSMRRANHQQQQSVVGTSQQHNQSSNLPPQPSTSRPVSAPSPAHMAAHFQDKGQDHLYMHQAQQSQGGPHTSNHRESPMGQSSSTQGQLDESSSSHQSKTSQDNFNAKSLHVNTNQYPDNSKATKLSDSSPSSLSQPSPNSPGSPNYAIGPSSKYPDNSSGRPTSARKPPTLPARSPQRLDKPGYPQRNVNNSDHSVGNERKQHNVSFPDMSDGVGTLVTRRKHSLSQDLTTALQAASREQSYKLNRSHDMSYDQSHDLSQDFQNESIFDYNVPPGSESTGSVTPPLPPLSPTNTPPETPRSDDEGQNLARSISATNVSFALRNGVDNLPRESWKQRRTSELNFRMDRKSHEHNKKSRSGYKSKGANLRNVNESETETESNQSFDFDIDNTILTIESHDTEQPHPAGDLMTSRENELRHQMHNLESRCHDIQSRVHLGGHGGHSSRGHSKGSNLAPPTIGRPRRWSIGSSDTSSFRREAKFKPGKQSHHKHHSKEFKNINKRFQRLESHVVTLARSVAHLSSELRTHNTMVNDLESVKRQLAELRDNPSRPFPNMLSGVLTEQQIFREWAPGLTNPKRVNKLTKFFGSEPPLLELFLQKLGYERYVPNFQTEHIGMIELPYMTEDRLEKIGIPMGPRLRILEEAKLCFRHDNVDIYVV